MTGPRLIFLCLVLAGHALGVDYATEIKPLLTAKCTSCHGAVRQKGGLRLDAGKFIQQGGKHGSAHDLLIEKVTLTNPAERMPPEGEGKPLTEAEVALLRTWIDSGAKFPADEAIEGDPAQFWSHLPPQKPAQGASIDDWYKPGQAVEPDRAVLLRRVYLDLIGLPPSREELHAFLADDAPDAYERVVDRLLERPEFGERWARHWMDVWRYCDWHGSANEIRYSQRHIWRWRDWIVKSLNQDVGYDDMILAMLAGDELAPDDPETLAATGFIGRNWYKFDRNVWMREVVEHTATGFLGMTLKCARCHDHKFDPLSQEEYFRFRAFFEPHGVRTDQVTAAVAYESFTDAGLPVPKDGLARAYDQTLDAATYVFERGDDRYPLKDKPLIPGVPAVMGGTKLEIHPVQLPLRAWAPMLTPEMLAGLRQQDYTPAERQALEARIAADVAKHLEAAPAEKIAALSAEAAKLERHAAVLTAEANLATQEAAPKTPENEKLLAAAKKAVDTARANAKKTDAAYTPLGPIYPKTSTGRRLALARWIASPKNPRTARVAVNQVWMRHFGRALAEPVADMGMRGSKTPEHLALLDGLAADFMAHGWSFKHLHRNIVTSQAYRRNPAARRLEAEAIRDSVLAIAQMLDPALGGPEIPFGQDQTVMRRSLYFQTAPNRQSVWLGVFDAASTEECYERKPSVIPQQSLALMNSSLAIEASRRVAGRHGKLSPADYVTAVFEEILSRPPSPAESTRCLRFLEEQTAYLKSGKLGPTLPPNAGTISAAVDAPAQRARENLALTLLNHNDFVTVR